MWVVALQWAATLQPEPSEQWWKVELAAPQQPSTTRVMTSTKEAAATNTSANAVQSPKEKAPPPDKTNKPSGKILVCKVVNYSLVRSALLGMDIAFEIHALLLDDSVEEFILLRTARDLESFVQTVGRNNQQSLIQNLPKFGDRPSLKDLDNSMSTVDSLLRSWVLSPEIVNSNALKEFLGLNLTKGSRPGLWTVHDARSILSRKTLSVVADHNDFVKHWIQVKPKRYHYSHRILAFRHDQSRHVYLVGGAVAIVGFQRIRSFCPMVALRADVLLISWIGAAYLGSRMIPSSIKPETRHPRKKATCVPKHESSPASSLPPQNISVDDVSTVIVPSDNENVLEEDEFLSTEEDEESEGEFAADSAHFSDSVLSSTLSSPLPKYPDNNGTTCWSIPSHEIFHVRGVNYFRDKVKVVSGPPPLKCRGVDIWMSDNPERHIARHPDVLGGRLNDEDTFLINFLLPFGNFVSYFSIPPLNQFPDKLRTTWTRFLKGDQQYRDARLKLLPVVVEGPWIVKTAVGPGKSPALLGKVIPLQYFFRSPDKKRKGIYEVDVIITASSIAKGILSVVKSQTKAVTIAFAIIIEAAEQVELPETVLCTFQIHSVHLEECPRLPERNLD